MREDPLSNAQAMNACVELAALADDKRLSKLALWGRPQWEDEPTEDKTAWMVSAAELEEFKVRNLYETTSGPQLVYRLRLKNGDEPTRFASFAGGGTCHATQIFNVSRLLHSIGDDVGIEEVPDPRDEIRWTYWGGGDYPVVYQGRNFMITSDLRDPNSVNMISWIKPDGRIRTASGSFRSTRRRWFTGQRCTIRIQLGAGCGSTHVWMSVVSKDLGSVAQDPLNKLLEKVDEGSMDIYEYKGRHYINTSVSRMKDALVSIQGKRIEQVCEFEWRWKSVVSKFFTLDQ